MEFLFLLQNAPVVKSKSYCQMPTNTNSATFGEKLLTLRKTAHFTKNCSYCQNLLILLNTAHFAKKCSHFSNSQILLTFPNFAHTIKILELPKNAHITNFRQLFVVRLFLQDFVHCVVVQHCGNIKDSLPQPIFRSFLFFKPLDQW